MPEMNIRAKLGKMLVSLASFINFSKTKKKLNQEILQKELEGYMTANGIDGASPDFDPVKFQSDFIKYLESKNYDCDDANMQVRRATPEDMIQLNELPEPKHITRISQRLNKCTKDIEIFTDTTEMIPGLVCYTIEKIAPTDKTPYVRYKPSPRVITQIHDSGVNGGTIFFSYEHQFVCDAKFSSKHPKKVVSESEVIYSPLTEEQAIYICKLLNAQSRLLYQKMLRKQQRTK